MEYVYFSLRNKYCCYIKAIFENAHVEVVNLEATLRCLMSDTVLMHWFYARVSTRGPSVGG